MSIILFAIIGATIKANVWYWIAYGAFCAARVIELIVSLCKEKERRTTWNF